MTFGRPNFALALCALAMLAGCGLPGAPQPPSLNLPKPVADLHAVRQGNKVTLSWTPPRETTDKVRMRRLGATRVCRTVPAGIAKTASAPPCQPIAEVPAPAEAKAAESATYVDTLPDDLQREHPLGVARYTVEVTNPQGRTAGPSNPAEVSLAPTPPAPAEVRAEVTHSAVVLTWSAPPDERQSSPGIQYRYRVLRLELNNPKARETEQSTVAMGRTQYSFEDRKFAWEKQYRYRVESETIAQLPGASATETIAGESSPPVDVATRDVFAPSVPEGVQAVFTAAGAQQYIDLTWLPSADADSAGYNVYRREEGTTPVKINTEIVRTPTFRDPNVAAGKRYFYSVSAVDEHGNESAHSAEASELVPAQP